MNNLLTIRPGAESDLNYIYSTWLRELRLGNDWFKKIEKAHFFKAYGPFLTSLLNRSNVLVVALKADEDVILAYIVLSGTALHFVYVKKPWRRQGLAKALVTQFKIKSVTHLTKMGEKHNQWPFRPFL